MRVVVIAESTMHHTTGVTRSIEKVLRHLKSRGHEVHLIAPRAAHEPDDAGLPGTAVELLRSLPLPSYPEVRITVARARSLEASLRSLAPDVVHLASPFVLGWQSLRAADHLGIPTVAIYQTDIPGYARRYGMPLAVPALTQHVARIHRRATLTLAPSSASMSELRSLGVTRLRLWTRGVDAERFRPANRSEQWRSQYASNGEVVIGYVGRLAPEKQVEDLRAIADMPGTKLVIVGDGPSRAALEEALPNAEFLGFQGGAQLAESLASFDLFVHPGENETFCQTIQEALASGVPTIATGRGGPLDLVQSSRTGWLYAPGDLADLRARVADLAGDAAKRQAFSLAARQSVEARTWEGVGDELIEHYRDAIASRRFRNGPTRVAPARAEAPPPWTRFVAIGDSNTEGLCDSSRQMPGQYRGYADRLAELIAHTAGRPDPLLYANVAIRSRDVSDVVIRQIPQALAMRADLVTVLIGANDMVRRIWDPEQLADELAPGLAQLRTAGADVLVLTPFLPVQASPAFAPLRRRATRFARELARVADQTGCGILDLTEEPAHRDPRSWGPDRVHLSSVGHRALAYRVAGALGVPGAKELGALDRVLHEEPASDPLSTPSWLWMHARPWALRRLQGKTAGDLRDQKHADLVPVTARGLDTADW